MVSQRGLDVLRAIVQDYVESREPVGSKSIVDRHNFGVSPATIRNEMALLEEENLIVAPHTSSGRVPTDKGYRIFVDHLAETRSISGAQRQAIERFLDESHDYDDLLQRTSRLLSQLTRQVAVVEYPSLGGAKVQRIELVNISNERLLCILIADNGRIDQRMIECGRDVSEGELNELSLRANGFVVPIFVRGAGRAQRFLLELSARLASCGDGNRRCNNGHGCGKPHPETRRFGSSKPGTYRRRLLGESVPGSRRH